MQLHTSTMKPTRQKTRSFSAIAAALLASVAVAPVAANDRVGADLRWFEVEVLVFKQTPQFHSDEEAFALPLRPIALTRQDDLLTPLRSQQLAQNLPSSLAGLAQPCLPASPHLSDFGLPEIPLTRLVAERDSWVTSADNQNTSEHLSQRLEGESLCFSEGEGETGLVNPWYRDPNAPQPRGSREVADVIIEGEGGDMLRTRSPFLLDSESFELTSLRNRLQNQSGKTMLLHTTWRQPVMNRNQGRKVRLFGGQNFSQDYDYLGFAKPQPASPSSWDDFEPNTNRLQVGVQQGPLESIDQLLRAIDAGAEPFSRPDTQALSLPERPQRTPANLPQDVWEFDGLMHIYLVGNFLHIDGEFNLREEVEIPLQATSLEAQAEAALRDESAVEPFLRGYYFSQLRRVISHETHYFDHPHFGVVVQIRRTDLSSRR
ncbi:MAG: peptidoglycan binding protein CsiV [Firmicutes bacterium]|nr:peptidoglycan binding protein CsiV [Bacillota bacterium]